MGGSRVTNSTTNVRQAETGEDRAADDQCEPFDLDAFLHQQGGWSIDWDRVLVWTTLIILCGAIWVGVIRGVLALI